MENKNVILKELSDINKYSHGIYGCHNGRPGHWVHEMIGPNSDVMKRYRQNGEREYGDLFHHRECGREFRAKMHEEPYANGYKFCMVFNDRRGDERPGSHTDYTLFIPNVKSSLISLISKNPDILIDLFKKIFPNYDRSNGDLKIEEEKEQ